MVSIDTSLADVPAMSASEAVMKLGNHVSEWLSSVMLGCLSPGVWAPQEWYLRHQWRHARGRIKKAGVGYGQEYEDQPKVRHEQQCILSCIRI